MMTINVNIALVLYPVEYYCYRLTPPWRRCIEGLAIPPNSSWQICRRSIRSTSFNKSFLYIPVVRNLDIFPSAVVCSRLCECRIIIVKCKFPVKVEIYPDSWIFGRKSLYANSEESQKQYSFLYYSSQMANLRFLSVNRGDGITTSPLTT